MRAHYNKLIQTELRQLRKFKEQAEKRSTPENIAKFENKIKELENELEQDTPRYLEYIEEQQEIIRIQHKHQNDKSIRSQAESENQVKLDAFYKQENKLRRDNRILQHQMRKEYDWLCRQDERLPDYIRTNLQKMPNNKGYIWKGIHYYGYLPAEKNNDMLIMFERPLGVTDMLIHEIKKGHYYKIFQKSRNGSNVLVSEKKL
jgi:vacuolar-type H+-ATPase subunit I/STV1